jgi:hypothetical protein
VVNHPSARFTARHSNALPTAERTIADTAGDRTPAGHVIIGGSTTGTATCSGHCKPRIVNACCSGYVATDFTGVTSTRTPEEGARITLKLATLPNYGRRGGFFDDAGSVAW